MGGWMICKNDIVSLKTDIQDKIGQKIIVKGSLGRSKPFEKEATIEKIYPNILVGKFEFKNKSVKKQPFNGKYELISLFTNIKIIDGIHTTNDNIIVLKKLFFTNPYSFSLSFL